jgi:type III pantothenate kinase
MSDHRALLFDVGNTRLKWGVLGNERIVRSGSIDRDKLKKQGFAALTTRLPANVDYVLASNVAGPAFATRLAGVIGIHCDTDVHFARSEKQACGVRNAYSQPRRLGVDRWVALLGARAETRSAVCVVDAGTAVTIDAMDRTGQHLGGQIIPGPRMMSVALSNETSDIGSPKGSARDPAAGMGLFARNTGDAVRNGTLSAVCGAIERAARVMRSAGLRPKIVLTGGDASRILKQLDGNVLHRPHLVLQGLAHMVQSKT